MRVTRLGQDMDIDAIPALVVDYRGAGFTAMAEDWDTFYTELAQVGAMRAALGITETTYLQSPAPDGTYWEITGS